MSFFIDLSARVEKKKFRRSASATGFVLGNKPALSFYIASACGLTPPRQISSQPKIRFLWAIAHRESDKKEAAVAMAVAVVVVVVRCASNTRGTTGSHNLLLMQPHRAPRVPKSQKGFCG